MNLTLTNLHPSLRPRRNKWLRKLRRLVRLASMEHRGRGGFRFRELGVVWLDDRRIAALNRRCLGHRGATDVLTFDYGNGVAEIMVSLDTAQRQARANGQTLERELTLYLAHGILHLVGFDDHTPSQIRRIRKEEQRFLGLLHEIGG